MGIITSDYIGSTQLMTSSANQEVIPSKPSHWTLPYNLKKFSFDNIHECHVLINNKANLFLKAGQGFESGYSDPPIYSFKIVESDVEYNWIAAY